ncbi:hypothetical protein SCLCIDRAFT_11024 [Scleroderma citrinum Foug A]|uniref:Uncharacterized protein n=1 Tax=Scleroderma citrinum Foug A TaxID=1036808 RepID=A0A0C3DGS7_9AGAM|nr:hypothetical protein SCLCIDRAFT_11024 [Scleroderma citrinum Foug A]
MVVHGKWAYSMQSSAVVVNVSDDSGGGGKHHHVLLVTIVAGINKKRDPNAQEPSAKPHAQCKKEIHVIIAQVVFTQDGYYGQAYALQPVKFASAVGSHLAFLKTKYHKQASRLSAKTFNAAPGTNQTKKFLSIIKHSRLTATSTHTSGTQVQSSNQGDAVANKGPVVKQPKDISMNKVAQQEDEDEVYGEGIREDEVEAFGGHGEEAFGGAEDQHMDGLVVDDITMMSVDGQAELEDPGAAYDAHQAERVKEHEEAEKIHCHTMEHKKMKIDLLKGEGEILHLKLELAKLHPIKLHCLLIPPTSTTTDQFANM